MIKHIKCVSQKNASTKWYNVPEFETTNLNRSSLFFKSLFGDLPGWIQISDSESIKIDSIVSVTRYHSITCIQGHLIRLVIKTDDSSRYWASVILPEPYNIPPQELTDIMYFEAMSKITNNPMISMNFPLPEFNLSEPEWSIGEEVFTHSNNPLGPPPQSE